MKKLLLIAGPYRDVALEYARCNPLVSAELVEKGAMLHDIGRGMSHTIQHAQLGADLLRARGTVRRLPVLLNVTREQDLRLMSVHSSGYLPVTACRRVQKRRLLLMLIISLTVERG